MRQNFGSTGPQWAHLANVLSAGGAGNQETAARLMEAQHRKWQLMANDRRDVKWVDFQFKEPNLPGITRVSDGQPRGSAMRDSDRG